jgi:TPR repeat protein
MKRWLLLIMFAGALLALYFVYKDNEPNQKKNASTEVIPVEASKTESAPSSQNNGSAAQSARKVKGPFRTEYGPPLMGNALQILSAYRNESSKADGKAAHAMFRVLAECSGQMQGGGTQDTEGNYRLDCTGVTLEDIAEMEDFLVIAANAGIPAAEVAYQGVVGSKYIDAESIAKDFKGFEKFRSNSMRYLTSAANKGNLEGMMLLSAAYEDGLITEKDNVRAYAYMYAANSSSLLKTPPTNLLANLEARMTPAEREQAINLGRSIYKSCCQ